MRYGIPATEKLGNYDRRPRSRGDGLELSGDAARNRLRRKPPPDIGRLLTPGIDFPYLDGLVLRAGN